MAKPRIDQVDKNRFKDLPLIILDAGHGGIIDGEYQTKGKRSPKWEDGRQLFEGEFNRAVVQRLMILLGRENIPAWNITDTQLDIPLNDRCEAANELHIKAGNSILISIHANAGGGTGFEVFTSPGETNADPIAETIIMQMKEDFPELRLRADTEDGDHDKEARFYMVKETVMPAVLIECAFMDTLTPDCELLMSEQGRDRFALSIFEGIKKVVYED